MYFRFDVANGVGNIVANEADPSTRVSLSGGPGPCSSIGGTGQFGMALQGTNNCGGVYFSQPYLNLSGAWTISLWLGGITNILSANYFFGDGSLNGGGSQFRAHTGTLLPSGGGNFMVQANGMNSIALNGVFNAAGTPVVITLVYDPALSNIKAYVNGVLTVTTPQPSNLVLTSSVAGSNGFLIGNYAANFSDGLPLGGKIDEFRMYNRALSASEISATWNQALPVLTACTGTPAAPTITTAPMAGSICNTATSITAAYSNCTSGISFQWEQAASASGPWGNAVGGSGSTTLTYTTPPITANTWYRIKAICANSSISTPSAAYAVNAAMPQPGNIAGSNTYCPGSTLNYGVPITSLNPTYTWSLPAGWSGTSTTNTISALTAGATGGTVSVTATGVCGTSIPRTLAVVLGATPPQPAAITGNATVCAGATQTYSIPANSTATAYNWVLPAGWIGSSNTNTISVTPGSASGNISVSIANNCGSSPVQTLAVTITTQPLNTGPIWGDSILCPNATPGWYRVVAIPGALSYTWTTPAGWVGASNTDSINLTSIPTSGTLTVTANNGCPGAVPSAKTIMVLPTLVPSVSITASATTICSGAPVAFTATPLNGGVLPLYQWLLNGVPMANTPTYTSSNLSTSDMVTLVMTSNYQCASPAAATSNTITMTVSSTAAAGVSITANPGTTITAGQTVVFTANPFNGGAAPTYQWHKNNVDLTGETAITYTTNMLVDGDNIGVRMQSSNTCAVTATANSNRLTMSIPSGISNVQGNASQVTLSPNPNTGHFMINAHWVAAMNGKPLVVEVLNATGQVIYTKMAMAKTGKWACEVTLPAVAAGLYLLRLKGDGVMVVKKFEVE